ncbi:MAG: FHA domain-containing protein [Deltaproteobacteria bacterium]|nr:MAG: FHA domain-containing protein [Deltaproteobacteria bacterium]
MHAACPSCHTPILGPQVPSTCPACGATLQPIAEKGAQAAASTASIRPPGATLVLYSPDGLSAEFEASGLVTIGRHYENVIVVADREVSKRHAVVEETSEGWVLRDLGSSNGTFVNGRRVDTLRLASGDEIRIGSSRIVFRLYRPEAGPHGETRSIAIVQAPSLTQVLASAPALTADEGETFPPAWQIEDVEVLRKDYERLRIAWRFHQEGGLVTSEEALYQRILDLCFEFLACDNGVVLTPQRDGTFEVQVVRSLESADEIRVSETLLEQVEQTREGVLSSDAITDHRFAAAESMVARGIRSVLAVPVIARETIRAIIYLDNRSRTSAFTPKDLDILNNIAQQAAVSLLNTELIAQIKQEEATRAQLERFLSPNLVQAASRGELDLKKGGSLVRATILFSDIRDFTRISERVPAEEVVRMLNEYFEEMVEVVFDHQGVLDKFIGDAVMALWGVPVAGDRDAVHAVEAALEMQRRVAAFNERRARQGADPIAVGIGVSTGDCVVGNMGSSRRLEYTVIGDVVNLASRLCSLAEGGEIYVSEGTAAALGGAYDLQALPPQAVKGKSRPVTIYRVRGDAA